MAHDYLGNANSADGVYRDTTKHNTIVSDRQAKPSAALSPYLLPNVSLNLFASALKVQA